VVQLLTKTIGREEISGHFCDCFPWVRFSLKLHLFIACSCPSLPRTELKRMTLLFAHHLEALVLSMFCSSSPIEAVQVFFLHVIHLQWTPDYPGQINRVAD
jgi:hypothetical protein